MLKSTPFQRLIHPHTEEEFFRNYWEQKPLVIKGQSSYSDIYSIAKLKKAIEDVTMLYTINLNVCKCIDNQKHMLEEYPTEVSLFEVEQYFEKHKATLQVLQPQQHTPKLANLLSEIESYFGCLVGNDVEVFIIQLEGKKQWKLHKPIYDLPSSCSGDLDFEEIGEPCLEVELQKGDVMYFPRGWIHHAETSDEMSTHITISTYQKHTYSELLNLAFPIALKQLERCNVDYRRGLPLSVFSHAGYVHAIDETRENEQYKKLLATSNKLISGLTETLGVAIHEAVDMMSVDFMESRLPPSKSQLERVLGNCSETEDEQGCFGPFPATAEYSVRLLDPSLCRLVIDDGDSTENEDQMSDESDLDDFGCVDVRDPFCQQESDDSEENNGSNDDDDEEAPALIEAQDGSNDESSDDESEISEGDVSEPTALLFYSTRNNPTSHMGPPTDTQNCLRFALELVPSISYLIQSYPKFVKIKNIPRTETQDVTSVLGMVVALWSCGILICEKLKKRKQQPASSSHEKKKRKYK